MSTFRQPGKRRMKRFSEDATASMISESESVWHSTPDNPILPQNESSKSPHLVQSTGSGVMQSNTGTAEHGRRGECREGDENLNRMGDQPGGKPHTESLGNEEGHPIVKPVLSNITNIAGSGRREVRGAGLRNNPIAVIARQGTGNLASGSSISKQLALTGSSVHSFFTEKLNLCGYVVKQPLASNELLCDMMNFRKKLSDWVNTNEDEMRRIETETSKFMKAMTSYLTNQDNFKLAMKPTKHKTELIQPSLIHCLLGIETLQQSVMDIVMPVLSKAARSTLDEDMQLVSNILNQLKWLSSIADGQKFTTSLLSVLDDAVFQSQASIIKELSNIIPFDLHLQVAENLLARFGDEGLQLNIPLMDCFSTLEISEGFWSGIRRTAIEQMTRAPMKDMPAYFSFVFQVESSSSLTELISIIREKVRFVKENDDKNYNAHQVYVMERIGFCITTNPAIATVWTKQVKEALGSSCVESIRKIDMIMLFAFAESHKSAIDVLKQLMMERKMAIELFSQMLRENAAMVNYLFQTISKLLDSLMRSRNDKFSSVVHEMTILLFFGLTPAEAQVLIGNMTSVLVNFPPSRDLILGILTGLAAKEPQKLLLFAPHLMGVLEHITHFTGRQIKTLMDTLAILSQTTPRRSAFDANQFNAEFSILLRKQLTHSDIKIRCFGVFGALATIRQMAIKNPHDNEGIFELMKFVWSIVERDDDGCCIFLDELADIVETLPWDICADFRKVLESKFSKLWTINAGDALKVGRLAERAGLNLVPMFNANSECEEGGPLVVFERQALEMSPLTIPSHLRALAILENWVKNGSLDEIDALLGCPILFPSLEEHFDPDSISMMRHDQRVLLGQYVVLAINFFRESISAFIKEEEPELRKKIWQRLHNIAKLQQLLVRNFDLFPSLPFAYAGNTSSELSRDGAAGPSGLLARSNIKKKSTGVKVRRTETGREAVPKKARKMKAKAEAVEGQGSENEEERNPDDMSVASRPRKSPTAKKMSKMSADEEIQPKKITAHIRRLDTSVFGLLSHPLRSGDDYLTNECGDTLAANSSDDQNLPEVVQAESFTPEILTLLLVELKQQISDDNNNNNNNNNNQRMLSIPNLLTNVCKQLKGILFILSANKNDERLIKGETLNQINCCTRLLIGLMTSYFMSITKLDKEERDEKLKNAVELLAQQNVEPDEAIDLCSQTVKISNMSAYVGSLGLYMKDPSTAMDHLKLLKTLHDLLLCGEVEMSKAIERATRTYLQSDWKLTSAQVDGFLKIWIGSTVTPLKVIRHLAIKLIPEHSETEDAKIPNSAMYTTCTDANFPVWYNAMFYGLSQYVHKHLRHVTDFDDGIREWKACIKIFQILVSVTRKFQVNLILLSCMKNCRLFLESFITGGAALLPGYFNRSEKEALRFCNALQTPCRLIQHICEHSKKKADQQLIKSVPGVKKVLETLIFRVRQVLVEIPGAADAFWIGNLHHRDLDGTRISTQFVVDKDETLFSSSDDDDEVDDIQLTGLSVDETEEAADQRNMDVEDTVAGEEEHISMYEEGGEDGMEVDEQELSGESGDE